MGTIPSRSLVLSPAYTDMTPFGCPGQRYTTLDDPKDPGYVTTLTFQTFVSTGAGDVAWTNPGNAISDNSLYATSAVGAILPYTTLLRCTNATNLSAIPDDAVLEQITVVVQGKSGPGTSGGWWTSTDSGIWLYNGDRIGDNGEADFDVMAGGKAIFGATDTDCTTTGVGDLWGSGLTEGREIKNSGFGVEMKLTTTEFGDVTINVDYVYMQIEWNNPLTPPQGAPKRYRNRPPLRRYPHILGGFR